MLFVEFIWSLQEHSKESYHDSRPSFLKRVPSEYCHSLFWIQFTACHLCCSKHLQFSGSHNSTRCFWSTAVGKEHIHGQRTCLNKAVIVVQSINHMVVFALCTCICFSILYKGTSLNRPCRLLTSVFKLPINVISTQLVTVAILLPFVGYLPSWPYSNNKCSPGHSPLWSF